MPGHFLKNILEHRLERLMHAMPQYTVRLCLFLGFLDQIGQLVMLRLMLLVAPFAQQDEVLFQPIDGITQRPFFKLLGSTIGTRIIRG